MDPDIHEEWLDWMMFTHIPEVMATGYFLENRVCRVHEYEDNGITYAVQYIAKSQQDLDEYMKSEANELRQKHTDKYGTRVAAFRTVLEILHEFKTPFADVSPN